MQSGTAEGCNPRGLRVGAGVCPDTPAAVNPGHLPRDSASDGITTEELMLRSLGILATVIAMAVVLYLYAKQAQTLAGSVPGGSLQSTPVITMVKDDLLGIANAERAYQAQAGRYASLDELTDGQPTVIRRERSPFSYSVETSETGFRVTATRSGPGSPSQLSIDETMEIQSSE